MLLTPLRRHILLLGTFLFSLVLLGSIPLIAVVTHQRSRRAEPSYAIAVPTATSPTDHGLQLYDREGNRVATCERQTSSGRLSHCHVEDGYELDDVMNAWLRAYEDR